MAFLSFGGRRIANSKQQVASATPNLDCHAANTTTTGACFPAAAATAKLAATTETPGRMIMPVVRTLIALCAGLAATAAHAQSDDAFYRGKRLTILINFAPGGPTDIEGRLFAKHLAKHVD